MAAAPPPPLASVSEAALRGCELREGADLDPGPRLPCTVSFVRGQERSVALSVAGMPPVRLPAMSRGGAPRGAGCGRSLSGVPGPARSRSCAGRSSPVALSVAGMPPVRLPA